MPVVEYIAIYCTPSKMNDQATTPPQQSPAPSSAVKRASDDSPDTNSPEARQRHTQRAGIPLRSSTAGQANQEESSDEPSMKDMLKELIKRFDKHESTTLASIASLQENLTSRIDAHETSWNNSRDSDRDLLNASVTDLQNTIEVHTTQLSDEIASMRRLVYEGVTTLRAGTSILGQNVRLLRRTLDSSVSGQVPHVFPQFQRLPFEIRCMIWEWATPSKILEVRDNLHIESHPDIIVFQFVGNCSPPVTAQVCRESRDLACRTGKIVSLQYCIPNGLREAVPGAPWGRERSAWFDSHRDSLYLRTDEDCVFATINLEHVRHVILTRQNCEEKVLNLLNRKLCPHLASIEVVCASVEWPMQTNLGFETTIWGDDYHIPIQTEKGDVAEAKRVHDDLSKLLGPQSDSHACIQRLVDTVAAQDSWDGAQHKALSADRIIQWWLELGLRGRSSPDVKTLEEMADKSMFRCIWMLSRIKHD